MQPSCSSKGLSAVERDDDSRCVCSDDRPSSQLLAVYSPSSSASAVLDLCSAVV